MRRSPAKPPSPPECRSDAGHGALDETNLRGYWLPIDADRDNPTDLPAHLLIVGFGHEDVELAVVLKKGGKHFSPEEASERIGGYVIFNDITARDIQRREMKSGVFSFCKGIDTFCPLGPWIVTADEIPNPHNLAMELRVNGESRQRSHSSKMSVKIPEILSHYSPMGYTAG